MRFFSRKPVYCAVCRTRLKHKHKPKREWGIKGPICGECHVTKTEEFYEAKVVQPCVTCGVHRRIADMWEPRWQWNMDGLLCKECFDKKEAKHASQKRVCAICGTGLKFIRYNPKPKWKIDGQLCRQCWDDTKAKMG